MKTKNVKDEFKNRTLNELKTLLKEAREVLFSLRLDKEQNKLQNLRSIFHKRKEIARILTEIKRKEIKA